MPKYYGRPGGFIARGAGAGYRVQRFRDGAGRSETYLAGVRARRAKAARLQSALLDPMLQNVVMRGALVRGEMKYKDIPPAVSTAVGAANFVLLNGIARGDEVFERNGREITMKQVVVNYMVRAPVVFVTPVINLQFSAVRVILFVDRQCNGAAPTLPMILTDSGNGQACCSNYNPEYKSRFYILADQVVNVGSVCSIASQHPPCAHRVISRYINTKVEYNNGDAGTVGDINTNSLYLVIIGDHAALGGQLDHTVSVSARVKFTDN